MTYLQNKYTLWYEALMLKAAKRELEGYQERHHILPASLGGKDEKSNYAFLTAREHFIAHAFLVRMTKGVARHKMNNALMAMINDHRKKQRYLPASRVIAKAREEFSQSQRHRMLSLPEKARKAFGQRQRGIPLSQEAKAKISLGNKGKIVSAETRARMRTSHQDRKPISDQARALISEASKNKTLSQESRKKISEALLGKPKSAETREKMSKSKLGLIISTETREKMSKAKLGGSLSEDAKAAKSASMKRYYENITDEKQRLNAEKISASKKGRSNGNEGKTRSDETKAKMSEARKLYWANRRALRANA